MASDPSIHPPVRVAAQAPDGWIDKTMLVYAAPAAPGEPAANMVVSRDALLPTESFREFCNRQVESFRTTLPRFDREEESPGRLREFDAFQILFTWMSGAGPLRQRVFFIAAGSGVVVTFAATAPAAEFHRHEPAFQQALASLQIIPAGA